MITLYTWTTPNGRKISIMLEELGLAYNVHPVDISKDQQFAPDFLVISPNNKIPAIVDHDAAGQPLAIFESGAVLTYLAEKTGRLLAASGPARYAAIEWLYWAIGGLGPMLGQLNHFAIQAKQAEAPATQRFMEEADRLLGVMDKRLQQSPYLGGDDYSIADIGAYPWAVAATTLLAPVLAPSIATKPSLRRWIAEVGARPAVVLGMNIPPGA